MRFKVALSVIVTASSLLLGFFTFVNSPKKVSTVRGERISGAYEALNFFTLARTYPNDQIPDDPYYKAFEQMKTEQLNKSFNNLDVEPWKAIGPHNTGGRTLSIAFNPQNPNTIYAGSASVGLWIS